MKWLSLFVAVLILSGCAEEVITPEWSIVEYNGHEYVQVIAYQQFGITHNPDCPCHNKISEAVVNESSDSFEQTAAEVQATMAENEKGLAHNWQLIHELEKSIAELEQSVAEYESIKRHQEWSRAASAALWDSLATHGE